MGRRKQNLKSGKRIEFESHSSISCSPLHKFFKNSYLVGSKECYLLSLKSYFLLESRNPMKFKHFFSISLFVSFCVFPCSMRHLVRVYLVVYYLKDLILHYGHNLHFFFNYFIVVRVVNNNKSYYLFRK